MKRASEEPTILVVDDSPIVLEATRTVLEAAGMRVIVHGSAEGTVAAVLSEQPDLLLLDVDLPKTSGDAIAAALQKTAPTHRTVVLLFSSLDRHLLRLKALRCGAHGFIQKTANPGELIAQVRHWLPESSQPMSGTVRIVDHVDGVADEIPSTRTPRRSERPRRRSSMPPARRTSGTMSITMPIVLFVDDESDALAAYRREFSAEHWAAEFSSSAERALFRLESTNPPDVVVSDILMPGMSGSELFYRAKAMDASWERRFVFVTGASSVSHVARFLTGTEARVLYKPVENDRLRHAIRYAALARTVFSDARLRGR